MVTSILNRSEGRVEQRQPSASECLSCLSQSTMQRLRVYPPPRAPELRSIWLVARISAREDLGCSLTAKKKKDYLLCKVALFVCLKVGIKDFTRRPEKTFIVSIDGSHDYIRSENNSFPLSLQYFCCWVVDWLGRREPVCDTEATSEPTAVLTAIKWKTIKIAWKTVIERAN